MTAPGSVRSRHIFRFGVYEFDSGTGQLRKNGLHVHLATQGQQALRLLLQRAGQPVSREELHVLLWPDQRYGEHDHSLNNVLNRIREALRDEADNPRFVRTLPRIGYVFVAPVYDGHAPPAAAVRTHRFPGPGQAALAAATLLSAVLLWTAVRVFSPSGSAPEIETLRALPLTGAAGYESTPSFSPDGVHLAFSWELNGMRHIYRAPVQGGPPVPLSAGAVQDSGSVWSPDGASIAFVRQTSRQSADVYVMPASGGTPQRLAQVQRGYSEAPLTWTADSRALVWGDISSDGEPWRLRLIAADGGAVRDLTAPTEFRGDATPAISPDGTRIAFARYTAAAASDLFLAAFDRGSVSNARRMTHWEREVEAIAWTRDGRRLILSAGGVARGTPVLYTIPADGGEAVRELSSARMEGSYPAVSRAGTLVFSRPIARRVAVWSLDLPAPGSGPGTLSRTIASSGRDLHPDLSPDGRRIAFCSTRSGFPEIWVANADGSAPSKLVSFGEAGASCPRWSPDGRRIAFEARRGGQSDIYVADAGTGSVQRITTDPGNDFLPAWSSDSTTLFFLSRRSGSPQIWAIPAAVGGAAVQVTRSGGFHPMAAPQTDVLYYTGSDGNPSLITRLRLSTGGTEAVLRGFRGVWSFAPVRDGIFYLEQPPLAPRNAVRFLRFEDGRDRRLADIPGAVHEGLSASSDGHRLLFPMEEAREANLVVIADPRSLWSRPRP